MGTPIVSLGEELKYTKMAATEARKHLAWETPRISYVRVLTASIYFLPLSLCVFTCIDPLWKKPARDLKSLVMH